MYYNSLLKTIGNTPLVKINLESPASILAKLEYLNPSGSLKDRPALFMIEEAERKGLLKAGNTIIDASSGNYGISLAMIGAIKGYSVIICVPEKTSTEKQQTIKAYGAELIVCPDTANVEDPNSYHNLAIKLSKEIPNSFIPNQYLNLSNTETHYKSTGPEIWHQTEGKITHFIAGAGTCGTISGVGQYLKQQNPAIKIIGVDSPNSFRATKGNPKPYQIEGIGIDLDSPVVDYTVMDEIIEVSDKDAFSYVPLLASKYGFLVGLSSGAVAYATAQYTKQLTKDNYVVIIFGDSGRAYLTKNIFAESKSEQSKSVTNRLRRHTLSNQKQIL
ncbi:cysteine synthase family protein [Candidatus Dependentiae bacterium]|nr:MAG: cysteine synthase family protein [Candidatus Dependentiae bacterium]